MAGLIVAFAVSSPLSTVAGSASSAMRTMRLALPVPAAASASSMCWNASRTRGWSSTAATSASAGSDGSSARQAATSGNTSAPTKASAAAGDHDVQRQRRESRQRRLAQGADMHPGAAGELEVLGDAAVEAQALLGMLRVDERSRIAKAEVAFVVERRAVRAGSFQ